MPLPALLGLSSQQLRRAAYWLLFVEAALFTFMRGEFGYYGSPVLMYLAGVLACGAVYLLLLRRPWLAVPAGSTRRLAWLAVLLGLVLGLMLCFRPLRTILQNFIVQISSSDIIPALSIYTKRFLADEQVYTLFTNELGYYALPTYLPGTWLPYLLPEWLRFDYRWMSVALLLLGVGAYQAVVLRLRRSFHDTFLLALLPFALLYAIMRTEPAMFGYTVESMVIGYYCLLMAGVLLRSWPLQVLGLLLCLLSRFSLVFWVPLFMALVFFQDSPRRAVTMAGAILVGIVGIYVVPFLSHDWGMFMRVQASYTEVAVGEWKHLNEQGLPYHLYNGVGFGNFFYRFWDGELIERVRALKTLHFALLVLIVSGSGLLYWRLPRLRIDYRVYAVLVLKLYLITFYAFLQVPYAYLASVGIFASVFLVLLVVGAGDEPAPEELKGATRPATEPVAQAAR